MESRKTFAQAVAVAALSAAASQAALVNDLSKVDPQPRRNDPPPKALRRFGYRTPEELAKAREIAAWNAQVEKRRREKRLAKLARRMQQ
jgi:hypothetical protein